MLNQPCQYCHKNIAVNWKIFVNILFAIALAALLGMFIDIMFNFESLLFDIILYFFAAYLPFSLGQRLFIGSVEEK